jgi:hypothetical protein
MRKCWLVVVCAAALALGACGQTFTSNLRPLPAGTYTNTTYHFKITYPSGWGYTALSCGSGQPSDSGCNALNGGGSSTSGGPTAIPLQVTITREGELTTSSPTVSELTISVLDLSNSNVATAAATLATDTSLRKMPLAGTTAYVTPAVQQQIPGNEGTPSAVSDTHTDYYLTHGAFEYQLSMDAFSNDASTAALQTMVRSFAFTA